MSPIVDRRTHAMVGHGLCGRLAALSCPKWLMYSLASRLLTDFRTVPPNDKEPLAPHTDLPSVDGGGVPWATFESSLPEGPTPVSRSSARAVTGRWGTARADTIVNNEVRRAADRSSGVGDRQDSGAYRIVSCQDAKFFGFAAPAQCSRPVFFPAEEVIRRELADVRAICRIPACQEVRRVARA